MFSSESSGESRKQLGKQSRLDPYAGSRTPRGPANVPDSVPQGTFRRDVGGYQYEIREDLKGCCDADLIKLIIDLNSDIPEGLQLPLPKYMPCDPNIEPYALQQKIDTYIISLEDVLNKLDENLNVMDISNLLGGGKINQKGGFSSRNQLIKFLLKLSRFIRRAAACTLLVGAAEQAKNIIMLLILKLSGPAVTTAATAVKTTGFMVATAAAAPSIATVVGTIPVAILAGVVGAGLLELAIYLSSDKWQRDLSGTELKRIEDRIKESEAAAASQDLEAAARIMEKNYERDKENYELRADVNVALADARLARFSAFKDDVVLINERCKQVFVVYRLSSQVIININDVVNYIAYLPDNMFEDARSIVENEDPEVKIERFRALKSKSQLLLLLMSFGLELNSIKALMVPIAAGKIGNNIYELVSIVYNAGIAGAGLNAMTAITGALVAAVQEIIRAARISEDANKADIEALFTDIENQINTGAFHAKQYGELVNRMSQGVPDDAELNSAVTAARQFANSQVQPGSELAEQAAGSENFGGGSRRRRRNNKPRKRKTLRKKSKRRKSTRRNSRKTTVRRKSRRLSRKSKRLSRKLKK